MRKVLTSVMALVIASGPALAGNGQVQLMERQQQRADEARPDNRDVRQDNREVRQDHREIRQDRRELRQDGRNGAPPREVRDDRRDWHEDRHDLRQDRRDFRDDRRDFHDDHRPQYIYNGREYHAWRGPRWSPPPNYAYREWRRGERLPDYYWREPRYYVDYRVYHLAPPPRGYRYVRVDNDVYLVAIASGLIAAGIMGLFYE